MKPFSLILISLLLISCNNKSSERKEILRSFDSVSRELQKVQANVELGTDAVYASLMKKLSNESGSMQQLYYTITDFHGYISELKNRFYTSCGSSGEHTIPPGAEGNSDITRTFFADKANGSNALYAQLRGLFDKILAHAATDSVKTAMLHYDLSILGNVHSMEEMKKMYFHATPPVAVITILNSFEQKTRQLELAILTDYYNNKLHDIKEKILRDGHSHRDSLSR